MSWKSGMRTIDKLEWHTVVAGTLKQELLEWQYVVFGSECVNDYKVILCSCGMKTDKAVLLQAWSGPEASRKLRSSDFMKTAQDGGKVVSLMHQLPLPPGNTRGTHFC